jgi:hypothetical protein
MSLAGQRFLLLVAHALPSLVRDMIIPESGSGWSLLWQEDDCIGDEMSPIARCELAKNCHHGAYGQVAHAKGLPILVKNLHIRSKLHLAWAIGRGQIQPLREDASDAPCQIGRISSRRLLRARARPGA